MAERRRSQPAVEYFIADFDPNNNDTIDWVLMVTFGTSAM